MISIEDTTMNDRTLPADPRRRKLPRWLRMVVRRSQWSSTAVWLSRKPLHNLSMPSAKAPPSIYQLKITLIGIEPPIWRYIQVPATIRQCCLNDAFQGAMGWTDSRLHQFEKDGKNWGVPEYDEFDELDIIDESKTRLAKILSTEGESLIYVYDFGDNWRHEVYGRKSSRRTISRKFRSVSTEHAVARPKM